MYLSHQHHGFLGRCTLLQGRWGWAAAVVWADASQMPVLAAAGQGMGS